MSTAEAATEAPADERILDATVAMLAREGIAGVSMRAVAREAGVALGLANYYFDSKTALVAAALERIGAADLELVHACDRFGHRHPLLHAPGCCGGSRRPLAERRRWP